jgi:hypothetical protein
MEGCGSRTALAPAYPEPRSDPQGDRPLCPSHLVPRGAFAGSNETQPLTKRQAYTRLTYSLYGEKTTPIL